MAPPRVLTSRSWRCAAQLVSTALGVALGTALAAACSTAEDECASTEPGPIELGSFPVVAAESGNPELSALLAGPEPATVSVSLNQLRIEYRRDGAPASVVYDVATKHE